ncbi:MAG: methyltransferase domain-containing protein [Raineya sp.]|nr:methyltransferase domain-containing protein [Raineya sp.]
MQKLHKNLCVATVEALESIFNEQRYADKVIEQLLKSNPKWGARDRAFIAENTYEIVRWWRRLLFLADDKYADDRKYPTVVFWKALGTWLVLQDVQLPSWEEFKQVAIGKIKQNSKKEMSRAIRESVPDWLDTLGEKELNKEWDKELKASNQTAKVVLRVNTLKTTKKELVKALQELEIETASVNLVENGLVLKERQNIFKTALFKDGYFEVQDTGSQKIGEYLQIPENAKSLRVVDACAGAGGKTLHLAAMMGNKGKIIALDTESWKLEELKKRSRRAGVSIIETRLIESTKTVKRLENTADRLLLDVPCSGLGVLRRNPDAKWKLSEDFINQIRTTQAEILENYSKILKKGGLMVYATCSLLPSENEKQVEAFLEKNPDFTLISQNHLRPSEYGFDGFYMALMERK